MQIEFNTHAKLSKEINISFEDFKKKMNEAKANGLTALAITEHFNAANIIEFYEMLQAEYPYETDYYKSEGMKIFCGLEVDVKENGHYLIIDSRDDIWTIAHLLIPYRDKDAFIPVINLNILTPYFNVLK